MRARGLSQVLIENLFTRFIISVMAPLIQVFLNVSFSI